MSIISFFLKPINQSIKTFFSKTNIAYIFAEIITIITTHHIAILASVLASFFHFLELIPVSPSQSQSTAELGEFNSCHRTYASTSTCVCRKMRSRNAHRRRRICAAKIATRPVCTEQYISTGSKPVRRVS